MQSDLRFIIALVAVCVLLASFVSNMLFHFQAQVYRGKPSQEVMLVVDEMAEAYSNADAQRANLSGFRRTILRKRWRYRDRPKGQNPQGLTIPRKSESYPPVPSGA